MTDDRQYFLGFSAFPGIGPYRFKLLLDYFGTVKDAWNATYDDLVKINLGEKLSRKFVDFRDKFSLYKYTQELGEKKIGFIITSDPQYPKLLAQIADAPFLIYYRGKPTILNRAQPYIGVVGTRRMTQYGKEVTEKLTRELVQAGFIIVSGMAYGVDACAHWSTIAESGETIAVLGCGVDLIRPPSNANLYHKIIDGYGAVISEFPVGLESSKGLFPARNRIISGLSLGIVVTEGAEDSGALITARDAAEQGREVFAVPGPITSSLSLGPTKLLKHGAKLVTEVADILEELNIRPVGQMRQIRQIGGLTKEEMKMIELLRNERLSFDEMVKKSKIEVGKLGAMLSMMEIKGIINVSGDSKYSLSS